MRTAGQHGNARWAAGSAAAVGTRPRSSSQSSPGVASSNPIRSSIRNNRKPAWLESLPSIAYAPEQPETIEVDVTSTFEMLGLEGIHGFYLRPNASDSAVWVSTMEHRDRSLRPRLRIELRAPPS